MKIQYVYSLMHRQWLYAQCHVWCPLILKFIQVVCVVKLFVRNCCGFHLNAVFTFVFIPLRWILFVFVETIHWHTFWHWKASKKNQIKNSSLLISPHSSFIIVDEMELAVKIVLALFEATKQTANISKVSFDFPVFIQNHFDVNKKVSIGLP